MTNEQLENLMRTAITKGERAFLAGNSEFQSGLKRFDGTPEGFDVLNKLGVDIILAAGRTRGEFNLQQQKSPGASSTPGQGR